MKSAILSLLLFSTSALAIDDEAPYPTCPNGIRATIEAIGFPPPSISPIFWYGSMTVFQEPDAPESDDLVIIHVVDVRGNDLPLPVDVYPWLEFHLTAGQLEVTTVDFDRCIALFQYSPDGTGPLDEIYNDPFGY
jgi:hypothetical protein